MFKKTLTVNESYVRHGLIDFQGFFSIPLALQNAEECAQKIFFHKIISRELESVTANYSLNDHVNLIRDILKTEDLLLGQKPQLIKTTLKLLNMRIPALTAKYSQSDYLSAVFILLDLFPDREIGCKKTIENKLHWDAFVDLRNCLRTLTATWQEKMYQLYNRGNYHKGLQHLRKLLQATCILDSQTRQNIISLAVHTIATLLATNSIYLDLYPTIENYAQEMQQITKLRTLTRELRNELINGLAINFSLNSPRLATNVCLPEEYAYLRELFHTLRLADNSALQIMVNSLQQGNTPAYVLSMVEQAEQAAQLAFNP